MSGRRYTMAEKLAYYKAKAGAPGRSRYQPGTTRSAPTRSAGAGRGKGKKDWGFNWDGWGVKAGFNYKSGRSAMAGMTRTTAPAAVSTHIKTSTPAIKAGVNKSFTIENRELLSNVTYNGDPGFSAVSYSINPGLPDIMPYAANIAKSYTRYKMEFCLEYAPSVPSTVAGTIALAYDRNSQAPPPASVQDIMSYEGSTVGSVWAATNFPANSARVTPSEKKLYTRYGVLTSGEDINLYDMCKVFVCLNGIASGGAIVANQSVGNVYINYKITFMNQKLSFVSSSNIFSYNDNFTSTSFAPLLVNPAIPEADLFSYNYEYGQGNVQFLPPSLAPTGNMTLVFPNQGAYAVVFHVYCVTQSGTLADYISASGLTSPVQYGNQIAWGTGTPDQRAVIAPSIGTLAYASGTYLIQVHANGTYIGEDNNIVGGGYITWAAPTVVSNLNANADIGTGVIIAIQSWLEVVQISGDELTFYDSTTFPPGPTVTALAHSIPHRRTYRSIQTGFSRGKRQALTITQKKNEEAEILEERQRRLRKEMKDEFFDRFFARFMEDGPSSSQELGEEEDDLEAVKAELAPELGPEDEEYAEFLRWKAKRDSTK